jgi:hypothetical protein
MSEFKCVVCDSPEPDLMSLKLPIRGEKRPVGIIYCCKGCKPQLITKILEIKEVLIEALQAYDKEMDYDKNLGEL